LSTAAIIGFGGGQGKTWASARVSSTDYSTNLGSFTTTDFYSVYDASSSTHQAQLIVGDSGGGDFIYNNSTHAWELAGLNEAYSSDQNTGAYQASFFVQLSTYKTQIQSAMAATAVPEPATLSLVAIGAFIALRRRR